MSFTHQLGLAFMPVADDSKTLPIDTHFDVAFANQVARLESYNKHHYRPNTYLHKWWARRCGTTFRLILKHLVENEAQRHFYIPGGLDGKVILDPMMGGGTTLHEALRLGANVIGVDIDPIPVLQARATLSDVPLRELEPAFDRLRVALLAELGTLFMTSCPHCAGETAVRFLLYGARRLCACGPVLSVDSLTLHYRPDGTPVCLCPRCHDITVGESCPCGESGERPRVIERAGTRCPDCGQLYVDEALPFYARYQPLAVTGDCDRHGLFFARPSTADLARLAQADGRRRLLNFSTNGTTAEAALAIRPGPKSDALLRRAISSYGDLFSSRQLIYLHTAIRILPDFDPLVRLNLALLISTSLEFNSMLCGYKGRQKRRAGAIRHTFSYHAYFFPHTALENNPLYPGPASGTLQRLFHDRIQRARQWALNPQERRPEGNRSNAVPIPGESDIGVEVNHTADLPPKGHGFRLIHRSSVALPLADESVDHVVTDPPYFDSVQYSDLAGFFRAWLKQLLPPGVDWAYDLTQSAVMVDGRGQYRDILSQIFSECHRVLRKENSRLIFTYHHWNPRSWADLTVALQTAGFTLLNRYVVHSENPMSVHIANMKALTHDAILVLAPLEVGLGKIWQRPPAIDQKDSEQFCYDCGTMLGWLLNEAAPAAVVEEAWQSLLDYDVRPGGDPPTRY